MLPGLLRIFLRTGGTSTLLQLAGVCNGVAQEELAKAGEQDASNL
jgi:hypothetical protein